jgi:GNAT superfamily N-acetyltransferase
MTAEVGDAAATRHATGVRENGAVEAEVNTFPHANASSRVVNERSGAFHVGFDTHTEPAPLAAGFEAGFEAEERLPFMVCAPEDLIGPDAVDGVTVRVLGPDASDAELEGLALAQHEAFVGAKVALDMEDAVSGLRSALVRGGRLVLAQGADGTPDAGVPMGGGAYSAPLAEATEVTGIAVRPAFRRRGIGAAVSALLTQTAFAEGLDCVWLTPAGPDQERMYASVGYWSSGETLFISIP